MGEEERNLFPDGREKERVMELELNMSEGLER
jgi:hypothetical protein